MLKILLTDSAKEFENQIKSLNSVADISLAEDGISLSCHSGSESLRVVKKDGSAEIYYGKRCEFFRGLLLLLQHEKDEELDITQKASFDFNGEMIDNSRNGVLSIKTAKEMIMYNALLGLDNILLYNEDTFEVTGEPYFGHMRMRYTQSEVRELTDFGKEFGVTMVPCIQTLAHLNQALRWKCYWDVCDYGDTILVREEKTYKIIENIIASWRKSVDTNIINIGMDEAYFLGRGQFQDKYGLCNKFEEMCRHLEKVIEICRKYGFTEIMMWSDMFFRALFGYDYYEGGSVDESLLKLVPKDVTLIYWDYYSTSKDKYDKQIKRHLDFKNNKVGFAGGAWKWSGITPAIRHSHIVSKMALQAARENGIKTIMTTAWGDNGTEGSIMNILPTLALYAEESYAASGDIDTEISDKLKVLTGYSLEEFFALCEPNITPTGNDVPHINPAKYLFFQDLLMGLFDYHVRADYPDFYAKTAEKLHELAKRKSKVSYVFDTLAKLCDVLKLKCYLGVELKTAYDSGNKKELKRIANRVIPELLKRLEIYYRAVRTQWFSENKTGGFDVQDVRFGGMKQRLVDTKEIINAYISGELLSIEELEQPRLPYDCRESDEGLDLNVDENGWERITSANKHS